MGHVRYSTAGDTVAANAQPILIECHRGPIALGPQRQPRQRGDAAPRAGGGGVHLPVHLRHRGHPPPLRAQPPRAAGGRDRGQPVEGDGRLLAALPHARRAGGRARPLGLPPAGDRRSWRARPSSAPRPARSTSSTPSTCATWSRASWSSIDRDGLRSFRPFPPEPHRQCVFEHVYFARPDSTRVRPQRAGVAPGAGPPARARGAGRGRHRGAGARQRHGRRARLRARRAACPFEWGLIRNHYVGRTFIEPKQSIRSFGVKIKLNPVRSVLEGKRVVLIDDSIVRGTTSRKIVEHGARGGRARGAPAHQQPAHHRALLLRHRHAHPRAS